MEGRIEIHNQNMNYIELSAQCARPLILQEKWGGGSKLSQVQSLDYSPVLNISNALNKTNTVPKTKSCVSFIWFYNR